MPRFGKPRRATRRANPALAKDFVRGLDDRIWTGLGTVLAAQGGGDHWESHEGQDITVRVELHPSGTVLRCRLGALAAGVGTGAWQVPPVGCEVAVLIPDGEPDAGGIIVATLSCGEIPEGVAPSDLVIVVPDGAKVYIRGAGGTPEPLVTKSQFDAHKHPTGTGPSGVPDNAATSGTDVLEAQ